MLNRRHNLLRKGMAAFLLLALMGSSVAFAAEVPEGGENTAGETTATEQTTEVKEPVQPDQMNRPEAELSDGTSENPDSVEIEAENEKTEDAIEQLEEDGGVLLVSRPVPADKTVRLNYKKTIKYESFSTHDFRVKCDGKEIRSYCLEPGVKWGGRKNYNAEPYDEKLMTKALYYSYYNPGYAKKTKAYLAGVSRKACYKGADGIYALCHILLSYVYDGEKDSGDAFKGCSQGTKKVVKNFLAKIKTWPDPPGKSELALSSSEVSAEWDKESMEQKTPEIQVLGTEGNRISVPVPEGATLHKGDLASEDGAVEVSVGESFYVTADRSVTETYKSPQLTGSITDFQPYIIRPAGKQNQIFSVNIENSVAYSIDWADFGRIELTKVSADPGRTEGNPFYSLKGAGYGLYAKDDDRQYGEMVTDESGKAVVENIPYGEYYIKETEAPQSYEIDGESHYISVENESQSISLEETPKVPELLTEASVKSPAGEGMAESESGTEKEIVEGGTVTIVDNVKYKGLVPGLEYKITGRLMNKNSGEEMAGTSEELIFTPENSSGSIDMTYSFDSDSLGGTTVVAFEKLYYNGALIATHEDINNRAQSISVSPEPESPSHPNEPRSEKGVNPPKTYDSTSINILLAVFILMMAGGIGGIAVIMRKSP